MSGQTESTLDLDQPDNLQAVRREWFAERIGWCATAACLVAAAVGFLGPGPLTFRDSESNDGRLRAEYYAVPRYSAPAELRIKLQPLQSDAESVEVAVSYSFLDEIKIDSITPEPLDAQLEEERVVYRFRPADLGQHGRVVYRFEHESFGPLGGTITLLPDSELELSQFVVP